MAWMSIFQKSKKKATLHSNGTSLRITDMRDLMVSTKFDSRFSEDKLLYLSERYLVILDGLILNSAELLSSAKVNSLQQWISKQNLGLDTPICSELRGPFTGCVYCPDENYFYAFGNQTGDTSIFYYNDNDFLAVSSDFNSIFGFCKENDRILSFNETAANHILSLGYLVEGNTFAREIHRVLPGEMICLRDKVIETTIYHRFDNSSPLKISMDEAVEMLDVGFQKAVKRCFDKDIEYGYTHHLCDMSGGLDSRMTTWVARELGYTDITNISYAKANSDEEKCARSAATYLGNEFIFKQLDDLHFFYDIESIIKMNYGSAMYEGSTGANRLLSDLNFSKFGLEYTGQLGDVIIGSYCHDPTQNSIIAPGKISSSDLILPIITCASQYGNHEMFAMYYRGFLGILSSHFIRRYYTEVVSPFIDPDFMQLCFSIPLQYRCNHKLYWAWLQKKYLAAASVMTTTHKPEKQGVTIRDIGRKVVGPHKRTVIKVLRRMGMHSLISPVNSMNPMDYWYGTNIDLRNFIDKYFQEHIGNLSDYPTTMNAVQKLFNGERATDKLLALTVLGAYWTYFMGNIELP